MNAIQHLAGGITATIELSDGLTVLTLNDNGTRWLLLALTPEQIDELAHWGPFPTGPFVALHPHTRWIFEDATRFVRESRLRLGQDERVPLAADTVALRLLAVAAQEGQQ